MDLGKTPHIPFGSKVLGWIPLSMQTKLSGRAFKALAVGPAPFIKGGILLLNLSTNRIVARRTFAVMGPYDHDFGDMLSKDIDQCLRLDPDENEIYYDPVHHITREEPCDQNLDIVDIEDTMTEDQLIEAMPQYPENLEAMEKLPKKKASRTYHYAREQRKNVKSNEKRYFDKIGL